MGFIGGSDILGFIGRSDTYWVVGFIGGGDLLGFVGGSEILGFILDFVGGSDTYLVSSDVISVFSSVRYTGLHQRKLYWVSL